MKTVTFDINHQAYTINIGDDINNKLTNGLSKFLPIDENLKIEDLLLAYLRKTQELIEFENKLEKIMDESIPSLESCIKNK